MAYWQYYNGRFEANILKNRENFVIDFDITDKKKSHLIPRHVYKQFATIKDSDHNETFISSNKNYILISSPYDKTDETPFIENGWTKYLNLYADSATTWYKIVPFKNKYPIHDDVILK